MVVDDTTYYRIDEFDRGPANPDAEASPAATGGSGGGEAHTCPSLTMQKHHLDSEPGEVSAVVIFCCIFLSIGSLFSWTGKT